VIVGLLSHFAEDPAWLRATIKSCLIVGIKKLVAVDGAYKTFPGALPASPESAHKAIERACKQFDIELIAHVPSEPWESEVAKRDFMFALGEKNCTEQDWYFVIDADERVIGIDGELTLKGDVAFAILKEPDGQQPIRCFFRAQRGLRVQHNHFTYLCGDQVLWGGPEEGEEEFAYDSRVTLEHLSHKRPAKRQEDKQAYYDHRDANRLEHLRCDWCGTYTPGRIPARWYLRDGEVRGFVVGCCPDCQPSAVEKGRELFESLTGSDVSLSYSV
jgi:hypothetical protein